MMDEYDDTYCPHAHFLDALSSPHLQRDPVKRAVGVMVVRLRGKVPDSSLRATVEAALTAADTTLV